MTIDLEKYTVNRSYVQKWMLDHPGEDVGSQISLFACTTHCPVIVVAFYAGEALGFPPKIVESIAGLIKFYDYKFILNQREGSPFLHMDKRRDIIE